MQYITAVLLSLCLYVPFLNGQDLLQHKIDQLFLESYGPDAPGVSVLIAKGEEVIYEQQLGLANLENKVAIDASSLFSVGSITKQFTAAAVLQLEEKQKLQLTDKVVKHLPQMTKYIPEVTIRQLINHTAGITDYPRIKAIREVIRNEPSVEELIKMALKDGPDFPPGTDYAYSNTGYLLLGKVIEAVSDQPLEQYFKQHLFAPAGMLNSQLVNFTSVLPNRTTPYSHDDDLGILRATPHAYSSAAGGLWSSPRELLLWMHALRAGKILLPTSLRRMFPTGHQKAPTDYYGWEVNEIAGRLSYEHTGFEPGYKANSIYLPEEDIYLIAVQNTEYGSPTPPLIKAAALCLGKPYPIKAESLNDLKLMERFTGRYTFSEGKERMIRLKNGQLNYQAPGGLPRRLYLLDSLTLFFEDGYRQLVLDPGSGKEATSLTYQNRRHAEKGQLMRKETEAERQAIVLSQEALIQFTGAYETEHFVINITLEGTQLYAQPEGSDRLPLTAYADRKFHIPELGAELEFSANEDRSTEVRILLEGNLFVGKRRL